MTDERMDSEMMALTLSEHVHDTKENPDGYLRRFLEELLTLEPGLRRHVSALVIGDLKGEVLRDDTDFAYAVHNAIVNVETKWRNDD